MSPEERELLNRSVELAEANNKLLRTMHRSMRIQRVLTLIYWAFIIGSAVGAIYLLQPYIDQLKSAYSGYNDILNSFK